MALNHALLFCRYFKRNESEKECAPVCVCAWVEKKGKKEQKQNLTDSAWSVWPFHAQFWISILNIFIYIYTHGIRNFFFRSEWTRTDRGIAGIFLLSHNLLCSFEFFFSTVFPIFPLFHIFFTTLVYSHTHPQRQAYIQTHTHSLCVFRMVVWVRVVLCARPFTIFRTRNIYTRCFFCWKL